MHVIQKICKAKLLLVKCFESYFIQNMNKIPPKCLKHSIWKILYVLGADEYLERLEGNIRKDLFFHIKIPNACPAWLSQTVFSLIFHFVVIITTNKYVVNFPTVQ